MKKEKILDYTIIAIFVILLFFVSDAIKISILTQPKLLGIIVGIVLIILFFSKKISLKNNKKRSLDYSFILFLLIISFIIFLSCIFNNCFKLTYLFEIVRPIIYASVVIIFSYLFKKESNKKIFNKIICILIPVMMIFGFIQFYNIGNINDLYIKIIAPTQYSTLVNNYAYPRIVGLLSNPNEYGFILALINLYLFYLILKNINNKKNVLILLILVIMNRMTLYLTGSRTSLIVSIFSELLFIFLYLIIKNRQKKIKQNFKPIFKSGLICLAILCVESAILFSLPNLYTWRVKNIFIGNIDSWEIRKDKNSQFIKDLLDNNEKDELTEADKNTEIENNDKKNNLENNNKKNNKIISIIIGNGPKKGGALYDNEYFRILDSYGILGIIAFILMFITPLFFVKRLNYIFGTYYITIISLNFIYILAAGSYFSYNLFISLLLFIFLAHTGEKNEK